jgi:ion channel
VAKDSRIQLRYEQAFDRLGMTGYRYGVLLVVIMISLVFQLAAPEADWARLVTIVLQGLTLLMALVASRVHPWVLRAALVAVCLAIIGSTAAFIGFGELGPTGARLLTALLVALAPLSIARGVIKDVQEHGVTMHTMFGVLCIYLLLGILFAFLYGAVGAIGSEPFFKQHAAESTKNFLYFSFVTITTVGYGDLTAGTYVGRSFAIAEALAGQIYLVTVVAAIVGGLGAKRRASDS